MLRSVALVVRRGGVQMHTSYRSVTGLASGMLRESIINHTRDKFINEEESFIDIPTIAVLDPKSTDLRVPFEASESLILQFKGADNPFDLVESEMAELANNVKDLLGVDHPVLSTVAKYFFEQDGGKKMRPAMAILMARAVESHKESINDPSIDRSIISTPATSRQKRLAEITEMIHTASLLHDDVIDMSDVRRGVASANSNFGNKLAVLAGDFLLARASVCLARLRSLEAMELLSVVIEQLVKGEILQISGPSTSGDHAAFDHYLKKTYYKTGSLMANSCKAEALLAGCDDEIQNIAFLYGKHIGLAFQLIDDLLDYEGSEKSLGKPALNDIRSGLATAPVMFAQEEFPELNKLVKRKFAAPGDIDRAIEYVNQSSGMARTRQLAISHAEAGVKEIMKLKPSRERNALIELARRVVHRSY